ncbi:MAG: Crp/Fnr family transcriptional regulator [Usitatibacter sp.]
MKLISSASHRAFFEGAAEPPHPAASRQVACSVCTMNPLCNPRAAPAGSSSPVERRHRVAAGKPLQAFSAPYGSIYAVRSGFLKVSGPEVDGASHIIRFLLPGDVTGLEVFASGMQQTRAEALEDCEVCEIPAYRAGILADFSPRIGAHLRNLLAGELAQCQADCAALARMTAGQRVARFVLDLSQRWSQRGYSANAFRLPMSRREIGDHLALTAETVCRFLSQFQARGWIRLSKGHVEIRDARRLAEHARSRPPA